MFNSCSQGRKLCLLNAISSGPFLQCCKNNNDAVCGPVTILAAITASDPCIASGTILVSSPVGSNWKYQADYTGSFQPSPSFKGLLPGKHTVIAKNEHNCIDSASVDVAMIAQGPLFSQVKALLATNCTRCHGGFNPQAGLNWGDNCDILNNWQRIKARAVDGNPSPMPQAGLLPIEERNKITAWINAGHLFEH